MKTSQLRKGTPASALLDPKIVVPAIGSAFVKLDPRTLIKNPVMFVLEVVTALTTVILIRDLVTGSQTIAFELQIVLWLWFTVLFANFAEAIAEGRGKAQADALRRQRTETQAKLLGGPATRNYKSVPGTSLKVGDLVLVEAGDFIPSRSEERRVGKECRSSSARDHSKKKQKRWLKTSSRYEEMTRTQDTEPAAA